MTGTVDTEYGQITVETGIWGTGGQYFTITMPWINDLRDTMPHDDFMTLFHELSDRAVERGRELLNPDV